MVLRERASTANGLDGSAHSTNSTSPPRSTAPSTRSLRMRRSFFGRSSSDAGISKRIPDQPSELTTTREESEARIPPRPGTALSLGNAIRRKTEPLSSIRHSIFGGRKNREQEEKGPSETLASNSQSEASNETAPGHNEDFASRGDYYRHLRKQSISPPFNFEHVTHTAKQQLPALETVDEKDLPGRFWSVSAYQRPRRHLHGIKAVDLHNRSRSEMIEEEPPSPRPVSLVSRINTNSETDLQEPFEQPLGSPNETTFDEAVETRFDPDDGAKTLESSEHLLKYPKRFSSLNALDMMSKAGHAYSQPGTTFYESASSNASGEEQLRPVSPLLAEYPAEDASERHQLPENESRSVSPLLDEASSRGETVRPATRGTDIRSISPLLNEDSSREDPLLRSPRNSNVRCISPLSTENPIDAAPDRALIQRGLDDQRSEDIAYRSRQPLPPLPPPAPKAVRRIPQSPLLSTGLTAVVSLASPTIPATKQTSPKSKRSSRSSRSTRKSPAAFSSTSDIRSSTNLSDATWEEDVDFCYEQEAESTCDFLWDLKKRPVRHSRTNDNAFLQEEAQYHAHSPNAEDESGDFFRRDSGKEIESERRQASQSRHRANPSVGHRGFLAARKSSENLLDKALHTPSPITITPESTQSSLLSPILSATGENFEVLKFPYPPNSLHPAGIDGAGLSDPESCRNSSSSKHRKSSSYGSYESSRRPSIRRPSKDSNRWSVVSSHSIPDLMRSQSKSKSSLSKKVISPPLETLQQSPRDEKQDRDDEDSKIVPRAFQEEPTRHSFVMRRPQTPGDRAVLQAAGRAVQRYRPETPSRQVRSPEPYERIAASSAAGPGWI